MIVAGFGFRRAATAESLLDALDKARGPQAPALLATAEDKAAAPAQNSARPKDMNTTAKGAIQA